MQVNWFLWEQRKQDSCHPGSICAPEDKDKMVERLSWLNFPLWKKNKWECRGHVVILMAGGTCWPCLGQVQACSASFLFPLCDSRGVAWDVTPTACCLFLPPAGLLYSSARLSWCQCHYLRLLSHWGRVEIVPLGAKNWPNIPGCCFGSDTLRAVSLFH